MSGAAPPRLAVRGALVVCAGVLALWSLTRVAPFLPRRGGVSAYLSPWRAIDSLADDAGALADDAGDEGDGVPDSGDGDDDSDDGGASPRGDTGDDDAAGPAAVVGGGGATGTGGGAAAAAARWASACSIRSKISITF